MHSECTVVVSLIRSWSRNTCLLYSISSVPSRHSALPSQNVIFKAQSLLLHLNVDLHPHSSAPGYMRKVYLSRSLDNMKGQPTNSLPLGPILTTRIANILSLYVAISKCWFGTSVWAFWRFYYMSNNVNPSLHIWSSWLLRWYASSFHVRRGSTIDFNDLFSHFPVSLHMHLTHNCKMHNGQCPLDMHTSCACVLLYRC